MTLAQLQQQLDALPDTALLVQAADGSLHRYTGMGIKPLWDAYHQGVLAEASVADKVIGAGAAALMAMGGVRRVTARVASAKAVRLLDNACIHSEIATTVPNIINRAGTGNCPLETLIGDRTDIQEIYDIITQFVNSHPQ